MRIVIGFSRRSGASQPGSFATFATFPSAVRLLVINQFGVNLGFYMLVPYLAYVIADDFGHGVVFAGLVLGLRTLSQQGMFLLGGTATDRLGARPVIIAGCALRAVGFGLLAVGGVSALLIAGAMVSGLAGALFNPAVRAYIAESAADRRAEAFAHFTVAANAGMLVGPLVGMAFLAVDFRLVAVVASAVFLLLTVAQARNLPPQPVAPTGDTVLADWRTAVTDVRFVLFALAGSSLFALHNQLYLLLPLRANAALGGSAGIAIVFAVATVVSLTVQIPLTRLLARRVGAHRAIWLGLATIATGFATVPALPSSSGPAAVVPVLICAACLSLGMAMAQPFVLERIAEHARTGLTGTYYGLFYLVSGLAAAGSSVAVGALSDDDGSGTGAWLLCTLAGGACALLAACRVTSPRPRPVAAPAVYTTHQGRNR
ncbi:MFS transporter [Phytoactinopolyspora mesophila]|uniref:MFS transporter n=1 Tax=Phytoactinopolyspora mesophila TaxID=2650750 RepID=A0A7K3LX24_9ACTN|nr:MFS transporter [Phytoactinopolyspora mesophila]NDL55510.1 MFS transporter [Phytoactinopolyspora mesophila]